MLYPSIKNGTAKSFSFRSLLQLKRIQARNLHNFTPLHSCICGKVYRNNQFPRVIYDSIRIHSTSSDQHRQKVVIETSNPDILGQNVDKIPEKSEDVLAVWRARIEPYAKLARWDKPIGVYLLYWPCAWSIALASVPGMLPLQESISMGALFFAGAVLMRGAGCTINDLWDRDVDAKVERTKDRPLVSGAVSASQAVTFLAAQLSVALGILLQLNCYSVVLGASSLLLVITYPLAKRFTNYPQLFLGATFNWGALLGYSALHGNVDLAVCVPLYLGSLAWTVIYDTIYAHQDKLDDARIGIKSTALTFGPSTKPALCATLAGSAALLAAAGHAAGLAAPYYAAVLGYTAHAGNQIYTLNTDNPDDCAKKFKSNSMVGLILFLGIIGGGYQQYLSNRDKHRGREDLSVTKSCLLGPGLALLGWITNDNKFRADDGEYTEVIHTNAGVAGYLATLGDVDFYPNGGVNMPGCDGMGCDHSRCFYYMAESILSGGFTGTRCATYAGAMSGNCWLWGTLNMGGLVPKTAQSGIYYLETNASPPFSRG